MPAALAHLILIGRPRRQPAIATGVRPPLSQRATASRHPDNLFGLPTIHRRRHNEIMIKGENGGGFVLYFRVLDYSVTSVPAR